MRPVPSYKQKFGQGNWTSRPYTKHKPPTTPWKIYSPAKQGAAWQWAMAASSTYQGHRRSEPSDNGRRHTESGSAAPPCKLWMLKWNIMGPQANRASRGISEGWRKMGKPYRALQQSTFPFILNCLSSSIFSSFPFIRLTVQQWMTDPHTPAMTTVVLIPPNLWWWGRCFHWDDLVRKWELFNKDLSIRRKRWRNGSCSGRLWAWLRSRLWGSAGKEEDGWWAP